MEDCLFCKIAAGDIPCKKVYEDDLCLAFYDIAPMAPKHFLVIPKLHMESVMDVSISNQDIIGHIFVVIANLTHELGFTNGFRVVTNAGHDAGQSVNHLHFHVLGGTELGAFN